MKIKFNLKDIRGKKYRFVVFDAESHNALWMKESNKFNVIVASVTAVVVVILTFYSLMAFTPLRETIPGYPNARSKREAVENRMKIDSLQRVMGVWELYSENILRALRAEDPIPVNEVISIAKSARATGDLSSKDSLIRERVRAEEQFSVGTTQERSLPIEGNVFFTPVKGVVTEHFRANHKAVDIATASNSVVKAILDGTVILTAYDESVGYIIQIQHDGDIISVYKHAQRLLKNIGDKVTSGMPICVAGNTGTLSYGNHLHLELWYKGEAVDPEDYITF